MKKILFALLLTTSSAFGRTLTQLQGDTRNLARDATSTSRQRFSDAIITEFLNQGQREAVSRSKCLERSFTFTLSAGTTYYSLPTDFDFVRRVTRGSLALTEMTPAGLDGRSRGWETSSGLPTYYYINFSSRGLIGFAPFPMTTSDTDTIKVDYFSSPIDMSAAGDVAYNGVNELIEYNAMLPYYAAARLAVIDGRVNIAQLYFQIYETWLKTMADSCKSRPNYLPSAVGIQ